MINDLEGELNVESDCEDDSTESECETPKMTEEQGDETRAVLIMGSFSAYVHFFAYLHLERNVGILQLESSVLLSLHGYNLVRSPQIARCRPSVGAHPRKDCGGGTASMLAEEHLRSCELGETTVNQMFHPRVDVSF